ncbi:MAG: ATP-grasp domain-containing protein [Vulcanimicrobiaceae bacterium]
MSTSRMPALLAAAGARVSALAPWPIQLGAHVHEHLLSSQNPATVANRLVELVARRAFDLVVVADEPLLGALLATKGPLPWYPVNLSDELALELILSKYALATRAEGLGLPVPESRLAATPQGWRNAASCLGFPVVVKGNRSFGAFEVTVAESQARLDAACAPLVARYGRVLLQRFVDGDEGGVAVVYRDGLPLAQLAYLSSCNYPEARSPTTVHRPFVAAAIGPLVERIGALTHFTGFAALDFIVARDGRISLLEINPRPTLAFCGTPANRALFAPAAHALLARNGSVDRATLALADEAVYFPSYGFYWLTRASPSERRTGRRLLRAARSFRPSEIALAAWETARFLRLLAAGLVRLIARRR